MASWVPHLDYPSRVPSFMSCELLTGLIQHISKSRCVMDFDSLQDFAHLHSLVQVLVWHLQYVNPQTANIRQEDTDHTMQVCMSIPCITKDVSTNTVFNQ